MKCGSDGPSVSFGINANNCIMVTTYYQTHGYQT
jgi:hypothetical protein